MTEDILKPLHEKLDKILLFLNGDLGKKGFVTRMEAHLEQSEQRDIEYIQKHRTWFKIKVGAIIQFTLFTIGIIYTAIKEIFK